MHYFLKAVPPRPNFAHEMSDTERAFMQEHVSYWQALCAGGTGVVFGAVFDPDAPYGIGVVEVETEDELEAIVRGDPAKKAGVVIHAYPMHVGGVRS